MMAFIGFPDPHSYFAKQFSPFPSPSRKLEVHCLEKVYTFPDKGAAT